LCPASAESFPVMAERERLVSVPGSGRRVRARGAATERTDRTYCGASAAQSLPAAPRPDAHARPGEPDAPLHVPTGQRGPADDGSPPGPPHLRRRMPLSGPHDAGAARRPGLGAEHLRRLQRSGHLPARRGLTGCAEAGSARAACEAITPGSGQQDASETTCKPSSVPRRMVAATVIHLRSAVTRRL
jgi:hypothetical protein